MKSHRALLWLRLRTSRTRGGLFDLPRQRTLNNVSGTYSYFVLKPQSYGNRGL